MKKKWSEWGPIKFIKEKLGFVEEEDEFSLGLETGEAAEALTDVLRHSPKRRKDLNILDYKERDLYIRECCEQMTVSSKEVESQKTEYRLVTERLSDLEEIASLPQSDINEVKKRVGKIIKIEEDEAAYRRPVSKITEAQYREMERMEDEIPDIISKLKKDEDYQMTVRRDLNLLEGEKGALAYQRKEEKNRAANAKALSTIVVFAAVTAVCLLAVLQFALRLDVKMGCIVTAGLAAIALTAAFVSYRNAADNESKADRKLNRTISLQNTVKIKYVNITNLLDYTYTKYKVNNSYELSYMWDKYLEEKEARHHTEEVAMKMEEARKSLFQLLVHFHIKDPSIWLYQPNVLIYEEEMTEVRHSLIIQRQKLRKGIDFNLFNLEDYKNEIEQVVKEYPQYAREILAIVSQYE